MSTRPLLEAHIDEPQDQLLRRVERLEDEIIDIQKALQDCLKSQREIQAVLNAMGQIFGAVNGGDIASPVTQRPHVSAAWEGWKQRFPGKTSDMISILLDGQKMTRDQLRIAMRAGWSTVDASIKKLRDLGLLLHDGRHYSLKQL